MALNLRADLLSAVDPAGKVIADVDDRERRRRGAEQRVKRRHPVRLGGRDGEASADVVKRAGADPADLVLYCVQHRQQQVPPGSRGVPAVSGMGVGRRALPAIPAALRRTKDRVDGSTLGIRRWRRRPELQVH